MMNVILKSIEVVEVEPKPTGVPWKEAPFGPARVTFAGESPIVAKEGDIVIICRDIIVAGRRWMFCRSNIGNGNEFMARRPCPDVCVEPLGAVDVTLHFGEGGT